MRFQCSHYLFMLVLLFTSETGQAQKIEQKIFIDDRDGNSYATVKIDELLWFSENLRYQTPNSMSVMDSSSRDASVCGEFYLVNEAFEVCPGGWRLPTEKEVKALLKDWRKGKVDLPDTLQIHLCGRIDNENLTRIGEQNTFWIDSELKEGSITHWHVFGSDMKLHNHNVVAARRRFPVRCVCEADQ
jgi:hypothetical protein